MSEDSTGKSPFVTIEKLAQYLSVSVSTVRAWVRQGHIPANTYIKLGNTYRFNMEAVASALMAMPKDDTESSEPEDTRQLEFDFDSDDDV